MEAVLAHGEEDDDKYGGAVAALVSASVPLRPLLDESVLAQMLLDGSAARNAPDLISWEIFCELTRDLRLQQRRRLKLRDGNNNGGGAGVLRSGGY